MISHEQHRSESKAGHPELTSHEEKTHEPEKLRFAVQEIASNLLLNLTTDGYPIYDDGVVVYKDEKGRYATEVAVSNAVLSKLPIDQGTGAVEVLPINEHSVNKIADELQLVEVIEDVQEDKGVDLRRLGFSTLVDVHIFDNSETSIVFAKPVEPRPEKATLDIGGAVRLHQLTLLPRSMTTAAVFCYLNKKDAGNYQLYFFSERDNQNKDQDENKNLTKTTLEKILTNSTNSLAARQAALRTNQSEQTTVAQPVRVLETELTQARFQVITTVQKKAFFKADEITSAQSYAEVQQDIHSRTNPRSWESYDYALSRWITAGRQMRSVDKIVVQGGGGLGDSVYQVLAAEVIAREFPDKKIVFHCQDFPTSVVDKSRLPTNFQVDSSINGRLYKRTKVGLKPEKVLVLNMALLLAEGSQVQAYEQSLPPKSATLKKLHKYFFPQRIEYLNDNISRKNSEWKPSLLSEWIELYQRKQDLPFDTGEYSQVAIYNSVLRRLLQMKGQISLENNALIKPEINENTPRYDVVIVYDSYSNGRIKVPTPVQLIQLIRKLQADGLSVGVVEGKTNPGDLVYIQKVCPEIGVVKGKLPEVLATILNARLAFLVDTGIGHMLNQIVESEESLPEAERVYSQLPKLISLVGADTGYPHSFFALSKSETIISGSSVATLDPDFIYEKSKAYV